MLIFIMHNLKNNSILAFNQGFGILIIIKDLSNPSFSFKTGNLNIFIRTIGLSQREAFLQDSYLPSDDEVTLFVAIIILLDDGVLLNIDQVEHGEINTLVKE